MFIFGPQRKLVVRNVKNGIGGVKFLINADFTMNFRINAQPVVDIG